MYQQYLDEDESWKTVEKDQDPFWDAPEDLAIGSVRVFSLSSVDSQWFWLIPL